MTTFCSLWTTVLTLFWSWGHIWPTRIDLWTDPISLRGRRCPAGLHTADTLACMHRFSHILSVSPEPSVWFMSELNAIESGQDRPHEGNMPICRSFPAVWNGYGRERVIALHRWVTKEGLTLNLDNDHLHRRQISRGGWNQVNDSRLGILVLGMYQISGWTGYPSRIWVSGSTRYPVSGK